MRPAAQRYLTRNKQSSDAEAAAATSAVIGCPRNGITSEAKPAMTGSRRAPHPAENPRVSVHGSAAIGACSLVVASTPAKRHDVHNDQPRRAQHVPQPPDSWKEIAEDLKRGVRTGQRGRRGLAPTHGLPEPGVVSLRSEHEAWWRSVVDERSGRDRHQTPPYDTFSGSRPAPRRSGRGGVVRSFLAEESAVDRIGLAQTSLGHYFTWRDRPARQDEGQRPPGGRYRSLDPAACPKREPVAIGEGLYENVGLAAGRSTSCRSESLGRPSATVCHMASVALGGMRTPLRSGDRDRGDRVLLGRVHLARNSNRWGGIRGWRSLERGPGDQSPPVGPP